MKIFSKGSIHAWDLRSRSQEAWVLKNPIEFGLLSTFMVEPNRKVRFNLIFISTFPVAHHGYAQRVLYRLGSAFPSSGQVLATSRKDEDPQTDAIHRHQKQAMDPGHMRKCQRCHSVGCREGVCGISIGMTHHLSEHASRSFESYPKMTIRNRPSSRFHWNQRYRITASKNCRDPSPLIHYRYVDMCSISDHISRAMLASAPS